MSHKIIRKDSEVAKQANLKDYDQMRRGFNYDEHVQELVWFEKGKINAAYNAITKNAYSDLKNKVALYYEDDEGNKEKYTFLEAEEISNQVGNSLKSIDVEKGIGCSFSYREFRD